MKAILLYMILGLFLSGMASESFESANSAYNEGDYDLAINQYEALIDANQFDDALYYNLANAHFRNEEFASAILYYEKALKLNPSHENAAFNLQIANQQIIDQIEALPSFWLADFWNGLVTSMHSNTWANVMQILLLLALFSIISFVFMSNIALKKLGLALAALSVVLSIGFYLIGNQRYQMDLNPQHAIVFSANVYVKHAPSDASADAFILHSGTKVAILDAVNGWTNIRLADGKTGWLLDTDIENI